MTVEYGKIQPWQKNTLRLKNPKKCGLIILACAHLHNFVIESKEDDDEFLLNFFGVEEEEPEDYFEEENEAVAGPNNPILRNPHLKNVFNTFKSINNL